MNQQKHLPKSAKIFENNNIWIALLKIMFPQIMIALLNGLYVFISQIFLNRIVPFDGVHDNAGIWSNYEYIANQLWPNLPWRDENLPLENATNVVRSAVTVCGPVLIMASSLSSWVAIGTFILFGQAIGKKHTSEATQVWTSWFFPVGLFCLFITIIFSALAYPWIKNSSGANHASSLAFLTDKLMQPLNPVQTTELKNFYKVYYEQVVNYSLQYALPNLLILFLHTFVTTINLCLISEGKQNTILLISAVCNFLNLVANFLLMYFAKLGILSLGLGVTISSIIRTLILITYLQRLNQSSQTLLTLNFINWKINWKISTEILVAGISPCLFNLCSAFSLVIFQSMLVTTTIKIKKRPTCWLNFGGAIMPIQNLFRSTTLGILRTNQLLFSYYLSSNQIRQVKKIFLIGTLYALILSGILFGIITNTTIGLGLMDKLFGLKPDTKCLENYAIIYMRVIFSAVITYSFMIPSIAFFQVAGRILIATIISILPGLIIPVTIFYIMTTVAIENANFLIYIIALPISGVINASLIFGYTFIYIIWYLKNDYKIFYPLEKFNRWWRKKHACKINERNE